MIKSVMNEKKPAETDENYEMGKILKSSKKYIYGAGLAISIIGIILLIAFTFLINDSIDKTREMIDSNLNAAVQNLANAETSAAVIEAQIDGINTTISTAQRSFVPLSNGIESASISLNGLSDMLSGLSSFGVSQNTINQLRSSSSSLHQSATLLNQSATSLNVQVNATSDLKTSVSQIKLGINNQKLALINTQSQIEIVFGNIKTANIIFFLIIFGMLSILGINSAAGII